MNTNITEKTIIDECRVNNRKFQKILFEKYYGKIMGVCIRYSKDEFQAKDYLQESFIKIFHQDYWFYIDNNDRDSKRYFSFVQLILNLVENQTPNQAPTLALPTN